MTTPYDPVAAVVDALRDAGCHVQGAGRDRYEAQCPAHDDRDPSLSVARGTKGEPKAVVYCHAGCGVSEILDALQLEPRALFADYSPSSGATVHHLHHVRAWNPEGTKQRPKPRPCRKEKITHYDYVWTDGSPAARVVKFHKIDLESGEITGKTFSQQRWNPDSLSYVNGLDDLDVPLYHADTVDAAIRDGIPIVVCEGEKDADAVVSTWRLPATTNPMGAGSWRPHHTQALTGAMVIIVADNDAVGRAHAYEVAEQLREVAQQVTIRLPASGKDLTDHIEAGGTLETLTEMDPEDVAADELEATRQAVRDLLPALDWNELWADDSDEEWILEPILPARRLVAVYSAPKVGKSLLMLEIAVGISLGAETLGYPVPRPFKVLYVDFENDPKGDIRSRLQAMEYGPDDLGNLFYLSFPTLAALDSPAGAQQLLAAVDAYGAEVVIIDTVSRAVKGDENENDTWLSFYRNTGLALKQAQVAMIRLDHSGKDETKGQRGGSAKSGDVDAIWRMSKNTEDTFELVCDAARIPIGVGWKHIVLRRETSPKLRHKVEPAGAAAAVKATIDELVVWLDANEVPADLSTNKTLELLRNRGNGKRKNIVTQAQEIRQQRLPAWKPDDE